MSAPTSGSSGSSSASPVPGYYPDPSIPNYIRYWNGSAWVPGTSRPAPAPGESLLPPQAAAPFPPAPAPASAPPSAMDESGPMFLDEDPHAPVAEFGRGRRRAAGPDPRTAMGRSSGTSAGTPSGAPPAATPVPAPAPAWPTPQAPAGSELPPISWGAGPAESAPAAPQPQPQPVRPRQYDRPRPVQPQLQPQPQPLPQAAPWAAQVHDLARQSGDEPPVTPWRPPADDPFAALLRSQDRPGGLLRRFAARVIDSVLLAAVTGAAAVPLGSAAYHHMKDKVDAAKLTGETVKVWLIDGTTGAQLGAVLAVAVLAGLLLEVLPTARWGRTAGKKLVGLRVLDVEAQQPPGFGASLRRWLTRTVLDVLVVGFVGVAWCVVDRPWRQGWHDKAARTFVAAG